MIERKTAIKRAGFRPAEPKPAKGPKPKKCANRECRKPYMPDPRQPFVTFCSPDCGAVIALDRIAKQKSKQQRQERAQDKVKREAMKTYPQLVAEAQREFNAFIRLRDSAKPCICCGRTSDKTFLTGSDWDAGHYRSTGSAPHLRFHEDNVHRQLVGCNRFGAGRAVDYRIGLIARIGLLRVEALEADNTPRKWTHDELREIRDAYRRRVRDMKKGNHDA